MDGPVSQLISAPDPDLSRPSRTAGACRHRRRGCAPREPPLAMSSLAFPDIWAALPEMVLAAAAMTLLILGVSRGEGSTRLVSWLSIGILILVFVIAALGGGDRRVGFYGMFVTDAFALFMKALVLI